MGRPPNSTSNEPGLSLTDMVLVTTALSGYTVTEVREEGPFMVSARVLTGATRKKIDTNKIKNLFKVRRRGILQVFKTVISIPPGDGSSG
jgi:hypothetical protein